MSVATAFKDNITWHFQNPPGRSSPQKNPSSVKFSNSFSNLSGGGGNGDMPKDIRGEFKPGLSFRFISTHLSWRGFAYCYVYINNLSNH